MRVSAKYLRKEERDGSWNKMNKTAVIVATYSSVVVQLTLSPVFLWNFTLKSFKMIKDYRRKKTLDILICSGE